MPTEGDDVRPGRLLFAGFIFLLASCWGDAIRGIKGKPSFSDLPDFSTKYRPKSIRQSCSLHSKKKKPNTDLPGTTEERPP